MWVLAQTVGRTSTTLRLQFKMGASFIPLSRLRTYQPRFFTHACHAANTSISKSINKSQFNLYTASCSCLVGVSCIWTWRVFFLRYLLYLQCIQPTCRSSADFSHFTFMIITEWAGQCAYTCFYRLSMPGKYLCKQQPTSSSGSVKNEQRYYAWVTRTRKVYGKKEHMAGQCKTWRLQKAPESL